MSAGSSKQDIVIRLRRWTHDVDAQPASDLMEEAAKEIERLRAKIGGEWPVRPDLDAVRQNHRRPDQR